MSPISTFFDTLASEQENSQASCTSGLRALLESPIILKVLFDGRCDYLALFHQFRVHPRRLYDIQVLYTLSFCPKAKYLKGLSKVFREYAVAFLGPQEQAYFKAVKDKGRALFDPSKGGDYQVWDARPLHPDLVTYCAGDVAHLLNMKRKWRFSEERIIALSTQRVEQVLQQDTEISALRDFPNREPHVRRSAQGQTAIAQGQSQMNAHDD